MNKKYAIKVRSRFDNKEITIAIKKSSEEANQFLQYFKNTMDSFPEMYIVDCYIEIIEEKEKISIWKEIKSWFLKK
jgi:hypothetical protein